MDPVEDVLRFHHPLTDEVFKREVKRLRAMAADPNWLYMTVTREQRELWQGDILPQAQLPFVNSDGFIEVVETRAMLLSTTCDAVPGQDPAAVLAPVYEVEEFAAELAPEQSQSYLAALRSNTYARYLYLPPVGTMPESYVNFAESASMSVRHLDRLREAAPLNERARFSRLGWYFFNYKLGYYYSRAEDEREIPRASTSPKIWTVWQDP